MYKILPVAAALAFCISCNGPKQTSGSPASNQLSPEEKSEGWQLLFNGKNTKGWHRYGGGAIDSVWKVQGDALCLDTMAKKAYNIKGDWDIVTEQEYDNFDLKLEWQISKDGNSGIIFYIHEDKAKHNWPWETGMEMQVLDNSGHPDAKYPKHRAGDLYDIIAVSKENVRPYGEWNQVEIRSLNGQLDFYLNGENVVSTKLWDDNWKKMIANSKFRNMAGFGTYTKGRIGLQDHGNGVCYRNIRIKRL